MSRSGYRCVVTFTIAVALLTVSVSSADEARKKDGAAAEYVVTEAELTVAIDAIRGSVRGLRGSGNR